MHYAVDGKRREGLESKTTGRMELDVAIYEVESRTVLAKSHVSDKKGESRIFRRLLRSWGFELPRGIFTMDAGITSPKFKDIVVSIAHGVSRTISDLTDTFHFKPQVCWRSSS